VRNDRAVAIDRVRGGGHELDSLAQAELMGSTRHLRTNGDAAE
jgi:hypothetical protein